MRVLHILESADNDRAANYAADVILGLQKSSLEQYVVINRASPRVPELEESGVKISSKLWRAPLPPLQKLGIQRMIAHLKPDIAQCWTRKATRLIPAGKTPVIGWLPSYDKPYRLPRCTHFVSASREAALQLAKESKTGVQAQFIPAFSESTVVPPLDRHILATPREAKVLLNPAPLHPDSRLEILFAGLKHLPGCMLWLIGDGPYRRVLERKARDMGVLERVRFAPLRLNRDALLRAADLCVLTAPDRPAGTLIPQAWAAGTPVIAGLHDGHAAPLEDENNGVLVPVGDVAALVSAVRRVLGEKTLHGRLSAKGYATYLGQYAFEAVIRQWMDLYRHITAQ